MYQGKFDKKRKSTTVSTSDLVAERNSSASSRQPAPQDAPAKRPAPQDAPARRSAPKDRTPMESLPRKQAAAQRETPAAKPVKKQPVRQEAVPQTPERRGPRLGGVIFYTLYFLFIFLFFVVVFFGLQRLQDFLVEYEGAQPTTKSAEVFHQLFDDPDWGALYEAAGIADTEYEGKEAFVTYMENLVGDQELTYQLTSTGMSEDVKYFVKLGDKRLAYFTLTGGEKNTSFNFIKLFDYLASSDTSADIAEWRLGEVGLFYERANGYRIQTVDGHIPQINGVSLTDDHVIQMSSMKNDDSGFLPAGYSSSKTSIYEITGLIAEPVITVVDSKGSQMEVVYDEATGMYVEQFEAVAISDAEKELALEALKVYAKYGIKEASGAEVGKYFDSTGSAYKSIIQTVLTWTKGNNGISFDKDTVSNYCRYGDDMFSVYVTTELTIKLTDGGTQTKAINSTLLFEKKGGTWKVTKMTNADVAQTVGKVRLTFMNGDTVLSKDFYDIESTTLETPRLSVPAGKVFSGWYRETIQDNGSRVQTLVFVPDENGDVTIPSGTTLEPMTLYPLFEDAAAAAAETPDATEGA
ncbi:MAG: hypothetical protein IJN20_00555 [Oscillospiraceae bacterium]|nr:hypothetical protein [Oscillospiraceae bacterium]